MSNDEFKVCFNNPEFDCIQISNDEAQKDIYKSLTNGESIVTKEHTKGMYNLMIAIEEMGELIQSVSHFIRHKDDKLDVLNALSDVLFTMEYIKEVTGITDDDIEKALIIKKLNLKNILKDGEYG